MIKGRRLALESLATAKIQAGEKVPGFKMHISLTDRAWKDPANAAALGLAFSVDMTETKTISPAQAQARGMSEVAVNALTSRHERPPKLARERV